MSDLNQQIKEILDRQQKRKLAVKPNQELKGTKTTENPLSWNSQAKQEAKPRPTTPQEEIIKPKS